MNYDDVTRSEKTISGALALATHLAFLALLVFGVSWQQRKPDSAVIVDLWNSLPPLPQPKIEEPPPEVKPPPEPPKPAPKVEPKPVVKPDIALKEKLEKERKLKEQLEAKKREEEKKRLAALKEQQEKEARAKREQEEALKQLAAQQASAQAKLIDEYKRRIRDKIRRFIVEPPNLQGNPEVEFDVVLLPGGEVLGVKLKKSSGVAAYDGAVERAVLKAQPLPLPPDPGLFRDFRELNLKFRPKE